jgi:3-dehydroquinate synthase
MKIPESLVNLLLPILDLVMHATFDIGSQINPYRVSIGANMLDVNTLCARDRLYLCDRFFARRLESCGCRIIAIDATEQAKSLDQLPGIIIKLRDAGATRQTLLVAVGGGVIQDIATFCASIYMRGISWVYLPTTLLGMVDSCIGGKSAINVGPYKNIVGNFYPAEEILIDPVLTETLDNEQKLAGLCEAAKICYARGHDVFIRYLALRPGLNMKQRELAKLIELSLLAKKWFIEMDEFDQNERLLLNFGHTFGHAIEGATQFRITHGVAVGVGILAAIYHARIIFGADEVPDRAIALETHIRFLLAQVAGLPGVLATIDPDDLFDRFGADKKHSPSAYSIVGLSHDGSLKIYKLPCGQESKAVIRQIFVAISQPDFLSGSIPEAR